MDELENRHKSLKADLEKRNALVVLFPGQRLYLNVKDAPFSINTSQVQWQADGLLCHIMFAMTAVTMEETCSF